MSDDSREKTPILERIMKSILVDLFLALGFVCVLVLVLLPMVQSRFPSLFKGKDTDQVTLSEEVMDVEKFDDGTYSVTLTGIVTNNTKTIQNNITIVYSILDEKDREIGSLYAVVDALNKGEHIGFTANSLDIFEFKPMSYELSAIILFDDNAK